jgi:S1-C subfamily serine protease
LRVARELQKSGALADSWWGFEAETLDADAAKALGTRAGAVITSIDEGSPADKAGLHRGDAVTQALGSPVRDADELRFLLNDVPLGTSATLTIVRGGQKQDVKLTAVPLTTERAVSVFQARSGISLTELSRSEAREAGYDAKGPLLAVKSVARGSPAARAGLRTGDLLIAVNSAEVESLRDFHKALSQARKSGRATILVQRGYRLQEYVIDLG